MSPTLARKLNWDKEPNDLDLNIQKLVKTASNVITPLGPINTFAARHPWMGMEQQSFEMAARRLKEMGDLDILPDDALFEAARNRGEIKEEFLTSGLRNWLDSQLLEMPRQAAEEYCRAVLFQKGVPSTLLSGSEVNSLVKKLSRFKLQFAEKHSILPLSRRLEQMGDAKVENHLNHHLIKWCKLFLDESQAVWSMPNREEGFYKAWRNLAKFDSALTSTEREALHHLPKEADLALKEALAALEIPVSEINGYLEAHLLALPGWAGMMLWRSQQGIKEQSLLVDYLAVRIYMEWILAKPYLPLPKQKTEKAFLDPLIAAWVHWGGMPVRALAQLPSAELKARLTLAYRFDKILRNRIWLEAWEKTYEDQLQEALTHQLPSAENVKSSLAQFAFCIDVRSEPFRRQLEKAGPFETFGAAGFFGLPIETCSLGSGHTHHSLPVMFKPQFKINEFASGSETKKYQKRKQTEVSLKHTFKTLKHSLFSSLLLPEISGPWLSLQTITRSFSPRGAGNAFRKWRETWLKKPETKLSIDQQHISEAELPVGFSEEEKVHYVRQALKMMGLTDQFAPLVVICGHGSHSTNNPYASALDCGACGGASGGFNARVLAELANLPKVRQALENDGIMIPKETVFAAAEHITTIDELKWLYVPELSASAKQSFHQIQSVLPQVRAKSCAERLAKLPALESSHKDPVVETERLAEDWSEVRPEWGLARNAAFIIGDRKLTKGCNLEGRAFLHNYNWEKDESGMTLSSIIAGPATVCQWINLQYFASTVAPHYYGSGNKATQTVTSGIGVMQGNASDLKPGLPWQSVMQSDQEAYHAPLRLLVVIQAPVEYVERLLAHDQEFRQKVQNGWLRLASIDPDGNWKNWQ